MGHQHVSMASWHVPVEHRQAWMAIQQVPVHRPQVPLALESCSEADDAGSRSRLADGPVRAIRHHDSVGFQSILIFFNELREVRGPDFLFPSMKTAISSGGLPRHT
jgi:hypothetical protein